jgi:O-antigen/teichoic acid export membrane protein
METAPPDQSATPDPQPHGAVWRRLRLNLSITIAGSVLTLVIGLGRTAFLTNWLSLADYGRVFIVLSFFMFLTMFLGVRVGDVLFRFFQRFEREGDRAGMRLLLWLTMWIAGAIGLLVSFTVLVLADVVAGRLYGSPELATPMRVYAISVVLLPLNGFSQTILRISNRFRMVVIPQVLGVLSSLLVMLSFGLFGMRPSITAAVVAFVVADLVAGIPALHAAVRSVRGYLVRGDDASARSAWKRHRKEFTGVFLNANLAGYVKLVFDPGDTFFLGLLSTPSQVGLYAVAKQITAALSALQSNAQTAITPEVTGLVAQDSLEELRSFLVRYLKVALIVGSVGVVAIAVGGKPFLDNVIGPEYLPALPIIFVRIAIIWVTIATVFLYPLALALGKLLSYNLSNIVSSVAFLLAATVIDLTAFRMSLIQAGASLLVKVVVGIAVLRAIRNFVPADRSDENPIPPVDETLAESSE